MSYVIKVDKRKKQYFISDYMLAEIKSTLREIKQLKKELGVVKVRSFIGYRKYNAYTNDPDNQNLIKWAKERKEKQNKINKYRYRVNKIEFYKIVIQREIKERFYGYKKEVRIQDFPSKKFSICKKLSWIGVI